MWPSKWNIPAHLGLAFSIVAYVIPIVFAGSLSKFPADVASHLLTIMAVGSLAYLYGLALSYVSSPARRGQKTTELGDPYHKRRTAIDPTRLLTITTIGICLALAAISAMGFVALFADDPMSAKYFRGAYASAYQPVAIPFRLGTSILTATLPLCILQAHREKRLRWFVLSIISLLILLATLQRGPLATGILMLLVVFLVRNNHTISAIVFAILSYVAGGLYYSLMRSLGLLTSTTSAANNSLFQTIATTVPDAADAADFLERWLSQGSPLTNGLTFLGGLVPGNYRWNPGVWSITLGDLDYDIQSASTGGLRLPVQIWGEVSFGTVGIIFLPTLVGFVIGRLIRDFRNRVDTDSGSQTLIELVRYNALASVLGGFYILSYVDVIQLTVILWISQSTSSQTSRVSSRLLKGKLVFSRKITSPEQNTRAVMDYSVTAAFTNSQETRSNHIASSTRSSV